MPARRTPTRTPEHERLEQARTGAAPWKAWGPYLSERQWGTVREDYSEDGDAWNYFTHDQARSRAYRWGEDGIAGVCDERQRLCLSLALWNGADPILKERMFGLSNGEGNHGEDVKEYWFYLDSTPTHSYMKCQYKYPQRAFPYRDLIETNGRRTKRDMEYELLDTGVFDGDRYFDVVVEYAKESPDDIVMLVTAYNRGPDPAALHVLPTLWFRNTWSWGDMTAKPAIAALDGPPGLAAARVTHDDLGEWLFCADASATLLFCENDTNNERLFGDPERLAVPQGRNQRLRRRRRHGCRQPRSDRHQGGRSACPRARPRPERADPRPAHRRRKLAADPLAAPFDDVLRTRRAEADKFYATVIPPALTADQALVMRQALAGLLWGKQYYEYDVHRWLTRARRRPVGAERADERRPERPVVPHARGRHHLDAGQVGVPVVRGLGPGLPLRAAVAGRHRLRQGAGGASAEDPLPAPQRADPGLRVELRRRQPARDALGGAVRLRARGRDSRRGRPRVPRSRVRSPADQLHLVGQPQGSRRPQPVPGGVPGTGQHRRSSTARRRCPAVVSSSRPTAPRGWPCTASGCSRSRSSCLRAARLHRHGAEVHRAFHVDLGGDEPTGGRLHAVGR